MKSIRILSFGILVTLLSFSGLQAFGHSPCKSEQKAVDTAERESRTADRILKNLKNERLDLYVQASGDPENAPVYGHKLDLYVQPIASGDLVAENAPVYGHKLSEIDKKIKKAEKVAKEKREQLQSARNTRDVCMGHAYRTCGCTVHHTESLTSCGCDYKTWNGWCHCPARSS